MKKKWKGYSLKNILLTQNEVVQPVLTKLGCNNGQLRHFKLLFVFGTKTGCLLQCFLAALMVITNKSGYWVPVPRGEKMRNCGKEKKEMRPPLPPPCHAWAAHWCCRCSQLVFWRGGRETGERHEADDVAKVCAAAAHFFSHSFSLRYRHPLARFNSFNL